MSVFELNPDAHLTNCSGLQGGLATETASEERAANAIASTAPTKDVGGVRALISYFGMAAGCQRGSTAPRNRGSFWLSPGPRPINRSRSTSSDLTSGICPNRRGHAVVDHAPVALSRAQIASRAAWGSRPPSVTNRNEDVRLIKVFLKIKERGLVVLEWTSASYVTVKSWPVVQLSELILLADWTLEVKPSVQVYDDAVNT